MWYLCVIHLLLKAIIIENRKHTGTNEIPVPIRGQNGAPCRFSVRFEDAIFSLKTNMKICSNLQWRLNVWRTEFCSGWRMKIKHCHVVADKDCVMKNVEDQRFEEPFYRWEENETLAFVGSPQNIDWNYWFGIWDGAMRSVFLGCGILSLTHWLWLDQNKTNCRPIGENYWL